METLDFSANDLKLKIPCGIVVAGPTMSGKTYAIVEKLISEAAETFDPPPKSIIYAYGQRGKHVVRIMRLGATVTEHAPGEDWLDKCEKPALVIYDDLMSELSEKYLTDLFTKKVHHMNLAVVFVTQNLYEKAMRVARMNSQYIFLTRAKAGGVNIRTLASQLFAGEAAFFKDAYKKAAYAPYKYLMIDLHPASHEALKLRTNIFPGEEHLLYRPRHSNE